MIATTFVLVNFEVWQWNFEKKGSEYRYFVQIQFDSVCYSSGHPYLPLSADEMIRRANSKRPRIEHAADTRQASRQVLAPDHGENFEYILLEGSSSTSRHFSPQPELSVPRRFHRPQALLVQLLAHTPPTVTHQSLWAVRNQRKPPQPLVRRHLFPLSATVQRSWVVGEISVPDVLGSVLVV